MTQALVFMAHGPMHPSKPLTITICSSPQVFYREQAAMMYDPLALGFGE